MDKRTVSSAHERIDKLEIQVAEIKTEIKIQFKHLFNKIRRLEMIIIGLTGASLLLLLNMNFLS
jgi:hypothetical protein